MLRTEAAEADRYRDDDEATNAMAQQEAAAGRTIAAMQGIPAGGRIARSGRPAPRGRGRHAARLGVRGERRTGVELLVGDGRVGRHARQQHRGARRDRRVGGRSAFSMASGEWISVRSQRELYENELRIESEELAAFPEEERDELELIYRCQGRDVGSGQALVDTIMEKGDVALDTLAREELGLGSDRARLTVGGCDARRSWRSRSALCCRSSRSSSGSGTSAIVVSAVLSVVALFAVVGAATSVFTGTPRRSRRSAHGAHRRRRSPPSPTASAPPSAPASDSVRRASLWRAESTRDE